MRHSTPLARQRAPWACLLGAGAAVLACARAWGFTVDDAWISVRVAHHIALGLGPRFNSQGPVSDAVTPLGWAELLSLGAGQGVEQGLRLAQQFGVAVSALTLGVLVSRQWAWFGAKAGVWLAAVMALSLPIGAWSVSGMETPWVMLLVTLGAVGDSRSAWFTGLAAAWRPELLPWALTRSCAGAWLEARNSRRLLVAALSSVLPAIAVALVRRLRFDSLVPLALSAKPAELGPGLRYTLGGLLLCGPSVLLLAGKSKYAALPMPLRACAFALLAHTCSLVLAGGDWMPLWRLWVPVLPLIGAIGTGLRHSWKRGLTLGAGVVALAAVLEFGMGQGVRAVQRERLALVSGLRRLEVPARELATVDVGWVGAAFDGSIVDLGGVTDPSIARLRGGHTSKRLPPRFAAARQVDAAVLLYDRGTSRPARSVERRLLGQLGESAATLLGTLPLNATQEYRVLSWPVAAPPNSPLP